MSKYIIELNDKCARGIVVFGKTDEGVISTTQYVENLEVLNSDYVNEHYGDLQDTAYQRGFEDGKAQSERGCEGCEYEQGGLHDACNQCCNSYHNQWTAKKEEIGVGDVVETKNGIIFVVIKTTPDGLVVGFTGDGSTCCFNITKITKTGEHYNINEILGGLCDD